MTQRGVAELAGLDETALSRILSGERKPRPVLLDLLGLKWKKMRKVAGKGPTKADIVIVGEAPGQEEELRGEPFVGAAGYELTKMLREAGINLDECYITNVCKYRPPANKMEQWLIDPSQKKKGCMGKKAAIEAGYVLRDKIGRAHV